MRRVLVIPVLLALSLPVAAQDEVRFNRDIRPILSDKCFFCHGPDEKTREADLRLDTREGALADLGGYAAIVPGQPDESELLARVAHSDPSELMPPPKSKKGRLTDEDVALLRRWIAEGAHYQSHWAFEPPAHAAPPDSWTGNPIDSFINAALTEAGIAPSPIADPATLIRRLSLDLTGLLPSPDEQREFERALASPEQGERAYSDLVDRLLASPHYGERWGRHWLDQARYADSHGYSIDGEREMWPYRDWVIKAHNDDLPFDRFTIEQLAGDLLPDPAKSQLIATAFHRNTLINQEGGSDREQFRVESVIDRVNTTGAVWLGLTLSCAQCHTHKFDPITQREYYQIFAFFNNAEDANAAGPTIEVAPHEVLGHAPPPPAPPEPDARQPAEWHPLRFAKHHTTSGAPLHLLDDNSLRVDQSATPRDEYRVTALTYLDRVAAIRLRVLTDESLPKSGPGTASNGNFVLTALNLSHDGKPVRIAQAFADHEQPGYPVAATIDGDPNTGWAINVGGGSNATMNAPHEAVFVLDKPLESAGRAFEIRLAHDLNDNYLIGRFALDVAATAPPVPPEPGPATPEARTGKLMIMRERRDHRPTYILTRGDFTRPDTEAGALTPGVLSHVTPALPAANRRPTRLDLARWLVDPANPLTPRVTVNRVWMRYFQRGLVETEEDFGTQGSPPTHPELLDYLARRFVEDGWSMKKLHRLIVTSEAYRRSSMARPDLAKADPRNLLLARQNRVRLDAEIIRDAALSASGLLTPTIGGPSVYPPQPDGIYAFTQNRKNWKTSSGPDRSRRGMYTFFYRSAPYPLFSTFDAPDFQTACTRRVRSNTPLQALTMANDPAFLEIAQGMAARIIREVPEGIEPRIRHAFQLALCRDPDHDELRVLTDYARTQAADFADDPKSARALLNQDLLATPEPIENSAALVGVSRAILNTDNFITRE